MCVPLLLLGCCGPSGLPAYLAWHTVRNHVRLLSRAVHLMAQHPGSWTLHDLFILTPIAGETPKDLQYVNVPNGLPQLVDRRFTRLMARFDIGVIPPLVLSIQKSSIVQDRWDSAWMHFPCAPDTVLTAEHYRDLSAKTLQTLVKPVKGDAELLTELGRHVTQRPPGDMDTTVAEAQDMLRACDTPDRYKRRRPAHAFVRRDPARIPAPLSMMKSPPPAGGGAGYPDLRAADFVGDDGWDPDYPLSRSSVRSQ